MKNTLFIKNKAELQAFLAYSKETDTKITTQSLSHMRKALRGDDSYAGFPLRLSVSDTFIVIHDSTAKYNEFYPEAEYRVPCKDHGLEYLEEFCAETKAVRWNDLEVGDVFSWDNSHNKSEYVKISKSSYASSSGVLNWGDFNGSYHGMEENHKVIRKNKTAKLVFEDNEG